MISIKLCKWMIMIVVIRIKKKIDDKEFEFSINILELVNWLKN